MDRHAQRVKTAAAVLIVEDQPAVARALQMLFGLHDIASCVAQDAESALRAVERGDPAVVLHDMNFTPGAMGGEEGVALFRRIRAMDPDLPILLMTAWTDLETAVQLVKEGASDYLAKPWNDAKLVATVQELLRAADVRADDARGRRERLSSREDLARRHDLRRIVYESPAMHRVVSLAVQVAASDVPVLITGPNGAGKEKIAEIIHAGSRRRERPLVRVNAGAIPDTLIESELFGTEAGAYTGASRMRIGRFEAADRGTLLLDEIGNLSAAGQVKLLRVLQTGEFERLGSSESRSVDVRLISATNADLQQAIARGQFRQDLYFRIAVVEIAVPALRQRREDVMPLADAFVQSAAESESSPAGAAVKPFEPAARAALMAHDWPGNVRELQNRVQRALAVGRGDVITAADLGFGGAADIEAAETAASGTSPDDAQERRRIETALLNADGSVSRAAEVLGLSRQALYRRMEKHGIILERRPR